MLEAVLAFLGGLLIGSFLNVCIYRMPRDLSVVRPRSFCPQCKKMVAWYDNIPVVSYLLLRGRCRHCQRSIPVRYPAVELLTGLLFALVVMLHGPTLAALKMWLFAALVVGLIFTDLEERILPDEFTLGGTLAALVIAAIVPMPPGFLSLFVPPGFPLVWLSLGEAVLGAVVASGALWTVGKAYELLRKREGLGFGDVKMVAMIGAFLGLSGALFTLVLGSVLGSVAGLAYILVTRKDASTYQLPYGSFLGAATLVVAVIGDALLAWYLGLGR